jgi:serine/threonine-protein kinase
VYAQADKLLATSFDRLRLEANGIPVQVVSGVSHSATGAQYSLAATGALAYVPGNRRASEFTLVWVTRDGKEQPLPGAPPRFYNQPRISPTEQRVVVDVVEGGILQVAQYDLARNRLTPVTFTDDGENRHGLWTDPTRIVFMSNREGKGATQLFRQPVDGGRPEQLTHFSAAPTADFLPIPYSYCGDSLILVRVAAGTYEMSTLPMGDAPGGSGRTQAIRPLSFRFAVDGGPQLSRDCRWLAYASDETGRREIYVRDFPGLKIKRQISTEGGNEPLWNPDQGKRELFYRSGDRMLAVEITEQGSAAGDARELFRRPYATGFNGFVRANYDVSPDGERFLMLKPVEREPLTQIKVVLNWDEVLRRLVPAR